MSIPKKEEKAATRGKGAKEEKKRSSASVVLLLVLPRAREREPAYPKNGRKLAAAALARSCAARPTDEGGDDYEGDGRSLTRSASAASDSPGWRRRRRGTRS